MSTCPDSDLFSAYLDGEIQSPWKEKIETHVDSCPVCGKKTEKYRNLRALIAADRDSATKIDLDASFQRLCAKKNCVVATIGSDARSKIPNWVHVSVRMPIAAFAAVLLAAIFLPAWLVLKTSGNLRAAKEEFSMMRQDVASLKKLASSTPVYSPDLSVAALPVRSLAEDTANAFSTVSYARQFAQDDSMFSEGDIIIIKMPNLTRFSEEDLFQGEKEPLLKAVGYYR